jgi:pyruvate dehydrogenase E1 component alpha subunit
LYTLGKIRGFLHLYIGEEAVAVGCMAALRAEDNVVATYREHGQALARGSDTAAVMAEMLGKVNGCSRGRGGSMHLFDVARRFYGGYAIVGGGMPIAVGLALADRLTKREAVSACFFGDGAMDEGEFHESMNLAALWQLPVLFICENNLYAMGTALERHQALPDLCAKPKAYGVEAAVVDGMDVIAVRDAAARAVQRIGQTGGPFFLEAQTYRFRAHSMYDAELYRSKEEVKRWATERDPIALFREQLRRKGWLDEVSDNRIEAEAQREIEKAVQIAEAGTLEPLEDLTVDVYTPKANAS